MGEYEKMGGRLADERDQLRDRVSELLAERTAHISEKAAAVLAERERVIEAIVAEHGRFKARHREFQFDAADIRAAGEAAPK